MYKLSCFVLINIAIILPILRIPVFFASSMICALIAGIWQAYEEHKLHKSYPDKFAPGFTEFLSKYLCCKKKKEEGVEQQGVQEVGVESDPTSTKVAVLPVGRSSMRLWAM